MTIDALAGRLSGLWDRPVRITGLTRLTGGASKVTWSLDAEGDGAATLPLILRAAREGDQVGGSLEMEAALLTAARRGGVPVPEVYDHGGPGLLDDAYLLMERLEGETIPRRLLTGRSFPLPPGLAAGLGAILARIHALPAADIPELETVADPVEELTTRYVPDGAQMSPALRIGVRSLAENRPPAAGPCLVHGDFRLGNLLVGPDGVRAVLDWELAHIGDPVEDLGWLCAKVWRFGAAAPVGGMGERQELLDGYAQVAGWRPTMAQLRWWELYATIRWGLICRIQAERHLSGAEPSVELVAIGRRACEQEFDVLLSLGLAEPQAVPDPLDEPGGGVADPHSGLPGVRDLLGGVRRFLTDEVMAEVGGQAGFHARVADGVLRVVERQTILGPQQRAAHQGRLRELGCAGDGELSDAIAAGTLDHRWEEVVAAVRAAVHDRLLVANPRHLGLPAG